MSLFLGTDFQNIITLFKFIISNAPEESKRLKNVPKNDQEFSVLRFYKKNAYALIQRNLCKVESLYISLRQTVTPYVDELTVKLL